VIALALERLIRAEFEVRLTGVPESKLWLLRWRRGTVRWRARHADLDELARNTLMWLDSRRTHEGEETDYAEPDEEWQTAG
jgi:hypothetical protein